MSGRAGRRRAGATAGPQAVGDRQAADVIVGGNADGGAPGGVQAADRRAVGLQHLPVGLVHAQPAERDGRAREAPVAGGNVQRVIGRRVQRLAEIVRLAERVGRAGARRRVVVAQRGGERFRRDADPARQRRDAARARREQHQDEGRHALEEPQPAEQRLPQRGAARPAVQDQPRMAVVGLAHRHAELRAVDLFVAEALAVAPHDDALRPRRRRVDETPRRNLVEPCRRATDGLAEADAAAVVAGGAEAQVPQVLRRVALHHLAVEDEAAGGQHHAAPGAHAQPRAGAHFQRRRLGAQAVRPAAEHVVQLVGLRGEAAVFGFRRRAWQQAPHFRADDGAVGVHDQPVRRAALPDAHAERFHALAQQVEQRPAGQPAPARAVAARRRFRLFRIGRNRLVAGVVEVDAVLRIGRLRRRHGGGEIRAQPFQPLDQRGRILAEPMQGAVADGIAGFLPQIVEHGRRRVLVAGGFLLRRAAAGVDHAAAHGGGAAAVEAIGDQHVRAAFTRRDRRRRARRAEAQYQHVAFRVPVRVGGGALRRLHRQRAVRRVVPVVCGKCREDGVGHGKLGSRRVSHYSSPRAGRVTRWE